MITAADGSYAGRYPRDVDETLTIDQAGYLSYQKQLEVVLLPASAAAPLK